MSEPVQRRTEGKRRCGTISGVERGECIHGDSRQAVVTGVFGASNCSARAAADSWSHPGLAGFSTPLTLQPRSLGLPCKFSALSRTQWMSKCRSLSAAVTLIAIEACRACRPVTALADWALGCHWACRRFVELTYSENLVREVKRRPSGGDAI